MVFLLSLLLFSSLIHVHYVHASDSDVFVQSKDCPCIDPWEKFSIARDQGNCPNGYFSTSIQGKSNGADDKCLPLDYGTGQCKAWDERNSDFSEKCIELDPPSEYICCYIVVLLL